MDEKQLKTSLKQRIIIAVVAILMLGSTLAVYAMIVISGNQSAEETAKNAEEIAELETKLTEVGEKIQSKIDEMSEKYLGEMKDYRARVKSYNATSANDGGLQVKDLKTGDGAEITTEFNDYYAYYIGWCSDEKVFDSSFSPSYEDPTALKEPLSGQMGLIAGWTEGVQGMKLGGARELTIPSELGYQDQDTACGANTPMKFVVKAVDPGQEYRDLYDEYTTIYYQIQALSM